MRPMIADPRLWCSECRHGIQPGRLPCPAKTQCPSYACLRAFKVRDVEDDLPEHDAPDGRTCCYMGLRTVLEVPLIRIAVLFTACLAALGPVTACGNPDAEAWESLISKGGQVEKELEQLQAEELAFFGYNSEWTLPQCARPTWGHMQNEVSGYDLFELSLELDRWQKYAEALAEGGAGSDLHFTASGHLVEIEVDVQAKRRAFDKGLETLEWLRCPVNPWKEGAFYSR